jgi:hypothetical protein
MKNYRTPTQAEQVLAFGNLMHQLHMHRAITMDQERVVKILDRMFSWTAAHSDCNGEASDREIQQKINRAFWEQIVIDPELGLTPRAKK